MKCVAGEGIAVAAVVVAAAAAVEEDFDRDEVGVVVAVEVWASVVVDFAEETDYFVHGSMNVSVVFDHIQHLLDV